MAQNEDRVRYAAFKAKDTRFDGCFFVGISSTGIYCRPVCRARLPKFENCTFFNSAAAAEQAGFRPCLRCRPELAPGTAAPVDAAGALALRATAMLEEHCSGNQSLEDIAGRLGCTARHLRRTFKAQYGVSPIRYLQSRRLLLAKNLLASTKLSIIEIALSAGFGSLRRFNGLFKQQYRQSPSTLRRLSANAKEPDNRIALSLGYRPPYQYEQILDFLGTRAIPGVETVKNGEYWRTICLTVAAGRQVRGWIKVGNVPQKNLLSVSMDAALLPALPQVLARVRHLFDLNCDPDAVYEGLGSMNKIQAGLCVPGTRLPGCFDAFEMAVRAVLGQQITVKAARTLAARLAAVYGAPIRTEVQELTHTFPAPEAICKLGPSIADHLGPLGITKKRAYTILHLANAFAENQLELYSHPELEMEKLMTIPGIGMWTAQYIAMRAMGWTDAFPHTDWGIKKALEPRTKKEILLLAEAWRPWRGYAAINLWNSL